MSTSATTYVSRIILLGALANIAALIVAILAPPTPATKLGCALLVLGVMGAPYCYLLLKSAPNASLRNRRVLKLSITVTINLGIAGIVVVPLTWPPGIPTDSGTALTPPKPPPIGPGEVPPSIRRFPVDTHYVASGAMGDIGDVEIGIGRFTYKTAGKGPHEYEWKYENEGRTLSARPAKFGGVVWLSPSGAFGTAPNGGYNLLGFRGIEWEARAIGDPVDVEFFIGGIDRIWIQDSDGRWKFDRAPYPDTMPRRSLGTRKLTNEWQTFRESLADQPESTFARVVGGFGWIANWGNNGVEPDESGMGSNKVKKFTFEVRNVFYVKEIE